MGDVGGWSQAEKGTRGRERVQTAKIAGADGVEEGHELVLIGGNATRELLLPPFAVLILDPQLPQQDERTSALERTPHMTIARHNTLCAAQYIYMYSFRTICDEYKILGKRRKKNRTSRAQTRTML